MRTKDAWLFTIWLLLLTPTVGFLFAMGAIEAIHFYELLMRSLP